MPRGEGSSPNGTKSPKRGGGGGKGVFLLIAAKDCIMTLLGGKGHPVSTPLDSTKSSQDVNGQKGGGGGGIFPWKPPQKAIYNNVMKKGKEKHCIQKGMEERASYAEVSFPGKKVSQNPYIDPQPLQGRKKKGKTERGEKTAAQI